MDPKSHETTERRLENLVFYRFDVQNKFVYYLLAINAACIAYSINFSKDIAFTYLEIPLAISVLFWAYSFYSGIVQIQSHEVALQLNINELSANVKGEKISEWTKAKQIALSKKSAKYRKWQNWSFFIGSMCFIIWRVTAIYHKHIV